jgi:hypothetical protein
MKKFSFVLFAVALSTAAFSQSQNEKEPYLTRSLSADAIKLVEAKTSGGSISVSGVSPDQARIEVYVSPNNDGKLSKQEIEQRLAELYSLDINVANNKLTATARSKENIRDWKKALNIAYKIYVPQAVSTDLGTSGGSIHLANLSGTQNFSTSGGSLHVTKVNGKLDGRTSGGSIHLIDSKDEIDLSTSGGSIHAANCTGNIRLATSGGSLELSDLKGIIKATTSGGGIRGSRVEGELTASTSGGSVRIQDHSGSLETSTNGGSIDVSFREVGRYVRVNNSAGNVDLTFPKNKGLDLDLSGRIDKASFANFDGKIDDQKVKGKLNGGGVPVTVGANAGRIRIGWQ